jgi:hypothetical protein
LGSGAYDVALYKIRARLLHSFCTATTGSTTAPLHANSFFHQLLQHSRTYDQDRNHGCPRTVRKLKRSRCLLHTYKRVCDCRSRCQRKLLQVRIYMLRLAIACRWRLWWAGIMRAILTVARQCLRSRTPGCHSHLPCHDRRNQDSRQTDCWVRSKVLRHAPEEWKTNTATVTRKVSSSPPQPQTKNSSTCEIPYPTKSRFNG